MTDPLHEMARRNQLELYGSSDLDLSGHPAHVDPDPLPRRSSICAVTLARDELAETVEIPDVLTDPELRDPPLHPADRPAIRFHAAAPLTGREGHAGDALRGRWSATTARHLERLTLIHLGYAAVHTLDQHRRRRST